MSLVIPTLFFSTLVKQQVGGCDCGMFAIAFATALAYGHSPWVNFDQSPARQHLLTCLENGRMELFPVTTIANRLSYSTPAYERIALFCNCRLPYSKTFHTNKFGNAMDMAQCGTCGLWYHRKCLGIPSVVFEKASEEWFCNSCR